MTTNGYTKTIKPVRDWTQRIWRLMLGDQVEIARGRMEGAHVQRPERPERPERAR